MVMSIPMWRFCSLGFLPRTCLSLRGGTSLSFSTFMILLTILEVFKQSLHGGACGIIPDGCLHYVMFTFNPGACGPGLPCRYRLHLWSQEVLGILESLAVGDEEIRFVSSDKRVKRTRSIIKYVIESGR